MGSKLGGERLTIHSTGNISEIRMWHGQGDEIARHIRKLMEQPSPDTVIASPAPPDALEQIKRLAELRDAGVLTDDEFASKKAQLLETL